MVLKKYISGVLLALVGFTFGFSDLQAAEALSAEISAVTNNGSIVMSPGERTEVLVEFLNTGTTSWKNDGYGYVSLYTHEPKYRRTVFDPGTWIWGDHVKRIKEASVAPGEKGTMAFELHAPQELGEYKEVFHLASEDTAWIDGGRLELNITVSDEVKGEVKGESTESDTLPSNTDGLSAEIAVQSANRVKSKAGKPILFTVAFENTGTTTWNSYGLRPSEANTVDFAHASWDAGSIAHVSGQPVAPGGKAIIQFAFSTPGYNGIHNALFQLEANGVDVPEAVLEVPVEVTEGSNDPAPTLTIPEDQKIYIEEPDIRVGVLIVDGETDDEVVITSLESAFDVQDLDGNVLAEYAAGTNVTGYYYGGKYYYGVGEDLVTTNSALRFVPRVDHAVMRVTNWDKRITRGSANADNEFRGVLEVRYNEYKERVWLINELGVDYYLRGLAETSNSHPEETNKAQVTAARTYAYYYVASGGKRSKEFMDLNSTPSDQYYLGYGQEKRGTAIVSAVAATRGQIIMHEDSIVFATYYARSNGSTKNWNGYGDKPYISAVSVPCDVGRTQWGHGLGMPQSGATCMAEDGAKWDEILKYFYTGVEVEKLWK